MAVAATRSVGLDESTRRTLRRGALWPGWVALAAVTLLSLSEVRVPPRYQYVPLAVSAVVVGLPHGAVDHLVPARIRGDLSTPASVGRVVALYLGLGGAYAVVWFLAPAPAFVGFVLLTWAHWGQGDLHALVALVGSDHLRSRGERALAVLVRGGFPMLVPLLAFPDWYRRVATDVVGLFGPRTAGLLEPLFRADVRLALGVGFAVAVVASLGLGYRRAGPSRAWRVEAGETLLLGAFFASVPPVLAIGLYFPLWHSLRHVARLVAVDSGARASVAGGRLGPAFARFARDAAPLTVASLALLGGFYALVPDPPAGLAGWIALYLALIAVLTLPHVVVVAWMDRADGIWRPAS